MHRKSLRPSHTTKEEEKNKQFNTHKTVNIISYVILNRKRQE